MEYVPVSIRNRVYKLAGLRGWKVQKWHTKEMCRILALSCRDIRDRMLAEGCSQGVEDLDRVWHQMMSDE